MSKFIIFAILLSMYNCKPTKHTPMHNTVANSSTKIDISKEMKEKGFSKGTLMINKSEGCPYILTIDSYKDNLDPINLNDFYKTEIPKEVWVKFSNLRRPSRCKMARPVSILEIEKRNTDK